MAVLFCCFVVFGGAVFGADAVDEGLSVGSPPGGAVVSKRRFLYEEWTGWVGGHNSAKEKTCAGEREKER